jgi:hypothetical protein
MIENGYKKRLQKAALEGVISRLKNDQVGYVVEFMDKCVVPEAVYESSEVRELALKHLKDSLGPYSFIDSKFNSLAKLMNAVKVPEHLVCETILDCFAKHLVSYNNRLPRYFEKVLEAIPIPVAVLSRQIKIRDAVMAEINSGASENLYQRQHCFLKYFALPAEAVNKMVKKAIISYVYGIGTKTLLDEFIKERQLNHEEVLSLLNAVVSELILRGEMDRVKTLMNKYALIPAFFLDDDNRNRAVDGVLNLLDEGEIREAKQMMDMFALTTADFEAGAFLRAIEGCLVRQKFDAAVRIVLLADLPDETMAPIIRRKLNEFVDAGAKKIRPMVEKYGIGWDEVVRAAEDAFVEGLARSGSKYVQKYIDEYELSKEFLASERVIEAAKKGLIEVYKNVNVTDDIEFLTSTFVLSI